DDQVDVTHGLARPPEALAGLLEIGGIGIIRLPYTAPARLVLSIALGRPDRLPQPARDQFGLPLIIIDPAMTSAAQRIEFALDCILGRKTQMVGALVAC
ncbi:MAG: phosphotransferase, partial [Acetobacteraceae bacterium]|nr:phosphotransferase [Acetobacteraceae bacterium]